MEIKIIDNFLTFYEINEYCQIFDNIHFHQSFDNDKNVSNRYKSFGVKKDISQVGMSNHEQYIFDKLKKNNLLFDGENLRVIFYNALKLGDKFKFHHDWDGHTFLLYVNKEWPWYWKSSTIFKQNNFHFYKAITPLPGRLIIFEGLTMHKASSPSIFYNAFARYSLVYQFSKL